MHRDLQEVLIPEDKLQARVAELAAEISRDYKGRCVTLIGVLKGCVLFLSDLLQNMNIETNVDFMMLSSYSGAQSTGVVRTILDLKQNIEGKDVLIVEDIVDSGLTMGYMMKNLATRQPRSLEICTLLDKTVCRKTSVPIKYPGFVIPDKFVVGYGLDYNELYRNLPYIGVLKRSALKEEGK
ncbi:MAG TPA: hypoxanthine phosphoribosyltransferase [Elusimicrobiales bacterium]|nr:hypoxanthine phosphoribosyltransferase [Elusimicrobiales bacterium]